MARRAALLGAAIAALLVSAPASAGQSPVAVIAMDRSADRRQTLEEGARREGALSIYTTGTQIEPLISAFRKLYPYIKVDLPRASSEDVARKVAEEYAAGVHLVDAFELSTFGLAPMLEQGFLQPYVSPAQAEFPPEAIGPQGAWTSVRLSYIGIGYNTRLIAAADAPKTYDDLLAPQWKGRLALSGAESSAANWVGALLKARNEAFVRELGRRDIRVYQITGRALANLVISGEAPIGLTIYSSHVEASKAAGAPIEWVAPGPVPVTDTGAALAAEAPHPHAAMLFIDFLLSREAQDLYRSLGYRSARRDAPADGHDPTQKLFLANDPEYSTKFEEWSDLVRRIFLETRR